MDTTMTVDTIQVDIDKTTEIMQEWLFQEETITLTKVAVEIALQTTIQEVIIITNTTIETITIQEDTITQTIEAMSTETTTVVQEWLYIEIQQE